MSKKKYSNHMGRCRDCGKQTKSHYVGHGQMQCHVCFTIEEERLKREEENKQIYLRNKLRDKEFPGDFEDVEEEVEE